MSSITSTTATHQVSTTPLFARLEALASSAMGSERSQSPCLPLLSFPNELLLMIAASLPIKDLSALTRTNRYLYALLNNELYDEGAFLLDDCGTWSPLHWAAQENQLNTARRLLSRGADRALQLRDSRHTPFAQAAAFGYLELAKLLYHDGWEETYDYEGYTALHAAVYADPGHDEIVEFILSKKPDAVSLPGRDDKKTPLHLAAEAGHVNRVTLLVSRGADLDAVDFRGSTPLNLAANGGPDHQEVCKELIKWGADPAKPDMHNNSPLHNAAWFGLIQLAKLLLDSGAPITQNADGETPIHRALACGMYEGVVKLFLERDKSGDIVKTVCSSGHPLLTYAFGCLTPPPVSMLKLMIDHGANVNMVSELNGQTPLFSAAAADNIKAMALFLACGADINAKDQYGTTVLHEAASFAQVPAIEMLVASGAVIDARDNEGQTPLYYAVERGRQDVVSALIKLGADINATDVFGMSPLSRACAQCYVHVNVGMVRLLVQQGADVRSKDGEGMNALHHASREGHVEVVQLLLRGGARASWLDARGENSLDLAEAFSRTEVIPLLRMNMGMIPA
jgi:ankyrin repeat protein